MVNDMKGYISMFTEVFGFHIDKIVGEKGNPEKLWFKECIQLNRTDSEIVRDGGIFNHLAISVDNQDEEANAYMEKYEADYLKKIGK